MRNACLLLVLLSGCAWELPPEGSYYDERISPTLHESCSVTTSGCHLADEQGRAVGNLDLSSYDSLMRRADALMAYGPYSRPLLLLKVSGPITVPVETLDGTVDIETDIRHSAGAGIAPGSPAFRDLVRWIESGYARTGAPVDRRPDSAICRVRRRSSSAMRSCVRRRRPPSSGSVVNESGRRAQRRPA